MRHAFKLTLNTFFVSGTVMVSILALAGLNSLCLVTFGTLISVPEVMYQLLLTIFKISGIITIVTFPAVLTSIMVKNYYDRTTVREGQLIVLCSIPVFLLIIVLPIVLVLIKEDYVGAGIWAGISIFGFIIGDAAKKYPFPKLCVE